MLALLLNDVCVERCGGLRIEGRRRDQAVQFPSVVRAYRT
jgi:hypothetical protein